jgi:hypothetical protein
MELFVVNRGSGDVGTWSSFYNPIPDEGGNASKFQVKIHKYNIDVM